MNHEKGSGAANTLKELLGSELWDAPAQDVGWERDESWNTNQPGEAGDPFLNLCSRVGAKQPKAAFGVYLLPFPESLVTCEESASHLGKEDALDSQATKKGEERKMQQHMVLTEWK